MILHIRRYFSVDSAREAVDRYQERCHDDEFVSALVALEHEGRGWLGYGLDGPVPSAVAEQLQRDLFAVLVALDRLADREEDLAAAMLVAAPPYHHPDL